MSKPTTTEQLLAENKKTNRALAENAKQQAEDGRRREAHEEAVSSHMTAQTTLLAKQEARMRSDQSAKERQKTLKNDIYELGKQIQSAAKAPEFSRYFITSALTKQAKQKGLKPESLEEISDKEKLDSVMVSLTELKEAAALALPDGDKTLVDKYFIMKDDSSSVNKALESCKDNLITLQASREAVVAKINGFMDQNRLNPKSDLYYTNIGTLLIMGAVILMIFSVGSFAANFFFGAIMTATTIYCFVKGVKTKNRKHVKESAIGEEQANLKKLESEISKCESEIQTRSLVVKQFKDLGNKIFSRDGGLERYV